MGLLKAFIRRDLAELHSQNVRIRVIGDRENLRGDILPLLLEAEETTRGNTGITLVIAFNYGSRDEMTRAMRSLALDVAQGRLSPAQITPELIVESAGYGGHSRPGSHHPHQRRRAAVQFSPVAGGLFGVDVRVRSSGRTSRGRYSWQRSKNMHARERRFGGLSPRQTLAVGS